LCNLVYFFINKITVLRYLIYNKYLVYFYYSPIV